MCGWTLELQQHQGTGTLHDVEVEQKGLLTAQITHTPHTHTSRSAHTNTSTNTHRKRVAHPNTSAHTQVFGEPPKKCGE